VLEQTDKPEAMSIVAKVAAFIGKWSGYSAFGTFVLYLFGYLVLRFQLSSYGVTAGLDAFDEKYLFAGSRYVVFLVSSVPNALLIFFVLTAAGYLPYKLIPAWAKAKLEKFGESWKTHPARLPFLGSLVALLFIQQVLRRCFVFGNLLLAKDLPACEWISDLLLAGTANLSLYFSGLVAGTMLTGVLLMLAWRQQAPTQISRYLLGLLAFLFAVEFLLLPVNYGILVGGQFLPRVVEASLAEAQPHGARTWLVWESKESVTYFVLVPEDNRFLLTVPRKETRISIVGYDRIFRVLFGDEKHKAAQQARQESCDE
jgi:hypothetical protein